MNASVPIRVFAVIQAKAAGTIGRRSLRVPMPNVHHYLGATVEQIRNSKDDIFWALSGEFVLTGAPTVVILIALPCSRNI